MNSLIQNLKEFVRVDLGLSSNVVLLLVGLALFFGSCLIARRSLSWAWGIAPGIVVSLVLEAVEILDVYGAIGLAQKETDQIAEILLRHAQDFLIMNLVPVLIVIAAKFWGRVAHK